LIARRFDPALLSPLPHPSAPGMDNISSRLRGRVAHRVLKSAGLVAVAIAARQASSYRYRSGDFPRGNCARRMPVKGIASAFVQSVQGLKKGAHVRNNNNSRAAVAANANRGTKHVAFASSRTEYYHPISRT